MNVDAFNTKFQMVFSLSKPTCLMNSPTSFLITSTISPNCPSPGPRKKPPFHAFLSAPETPPRSSPASPEAGVSSQDVNAVEVGELRDNLNKLLVLDGRLGNVPNTSHTLLHPGEMFLNKSQSIRLQKQLLRRPASKESNPKTSPS